MIIPNVDRPIIQASEVGFIDKYHRKQCYAQENYR